MSLKRWLYRSKRSLYPGGHPNRLAGVLNRGWAALCGLGLVPDYLVALEVVGRRSGRVFTLPLVIAVVDGQRYLVSMLGESVDWVRNVRAAGGRVVLRHGRRERVRLEEVPVDMRAPVLKAYLKRASGARPHVAVDKDAPLSEFERIAAQIPVFRVTSEPNQAHPADAKEAGLPKAF